MGTTKRKITRVRMMVMDVERACIGTINMPFTLSGQAKAVAKVNAAVPCFHLNLQPDLQGVLEGRMFAEAEKKVMDKSSNNSLFSDG
jgi:hypothetical protein